MTAPDFAAILDTHEWTWAKRDRQSNDGVLLGCSGCDWTHEPSGATGLGWTPQHAHLADVLTAALTQHEAEVGARALRDAADALAPRFETDADGMRYWLRARADALTTEEGA